MSKLTKALCEEFGVPDVGSPAGMNSIETVNTKIERAEKTEEVDTVTFGLETDDGRIIKVYVKAEEAEDFEEALSKELGVEDVIEDVLNKLSKDFDIIDVEWPDQQNDDNEESEEDDDIEVDDVDMDPEEKDGSESMNKKAWGGKSGREKVKHLVKKESNMSYGQLFTKKLLGEKMSKEKSIERALEFINNCGPNSQERPGLVRSVQQYLKDMEKMSKQEQIKFAIDFVKRIAAGNERPGLVRSAKEIIKNLDPSVLEEGKRFVTLINGKEKVFMAFDEKTANNMAKKWGGDAVKPFKGHNTGGAKKKVSESKLNQGYMRNPNHGPEYSDIEAIVNKFGKKRVMDWLDGKKNDDILKSAFMDFYVNNNDGPRGRVEDDVWLTKKLWNDLDDAGLINSKTGKWIAEGTNSGIDNIVDKFGKKAIIAWLNNGENDELEDAILDYYSNNGEMPYGTMKARTGDPKNWIADHFPDALADEGYIDKKTHKWLADDGMAEYGKKKVNEFKYGGPADEKEVVKQPGGKKYKVGLLDSRFSTIYQFMIYQALLDLGIPDEALNRAPQKNALVTSIRDMAKELQKDPVRRQALRFLINRLKETTDVVEEAKKDDKDDANKDGTVSAKEKKEAEAMKVGALDDRFVTVIQKMLYQTILMLGLPDSFIVKSSYKNTIVNSIKNKAKEFQKDSVKRSALRIFTHRFEEANESLNEERIDENVGSDTMGLIVNLINKLVPSDKTELVGKLEDTAAWTQVKRAVTNNTAVNQTIAPIRQHLVSIAKKMAVGNTTFKEQLGLAEAKWGGDPMLDDPEDKEQDQDTKVKMPKRKKDKRAGEEAEWTINKNKKSGELTLENDEFTVTLDDEATEKLIKAIANKSIAVLPDSEISGTKWVFSPRARTYMVKRAGAPAVEKPLILSWEDTNSIEDIYLGTIKESKSVTYPWAKEMEKVLKSVDKRFDAMEANSDEGYGIDNSVVDKFKSAFKNAGYKIVKQPKGFRIPHKDQKNVGVFFTDETDWGNPGIWSIGFYNKDFK